MKKRIMMLGFALISMFAISNGVKAITDVNCITGEDNQKCKLSDDIVVTEALRVQSEIELDLNGHTIRPDDNVKISGGVIGVLRGGKLTIKDSAGNGKITSGSSGDVYAAVQVTMPGENDATEAATLVVESGTLEGYYYAITGNGNRHNTNITINGGTLIGLATDGLGIYHPQDGIITVNGGTIKGGTGIEIRAGVLNVNGGIIEGINVPVTVTPNGSGSTTDGAGIAIAQHNTAKNIKVTVKAGTIKGFSAIYESNPQKNTNIKEQVNIDIIGGIFEAINGGELAVYSEDLTKFISKGTFKGEVEDKYISETSKTKLTDGKNVVEPNTIIETNNEDIVFESEEAFSTGYKLVAEEITAEDKEKVSKEVVKLSKENKEMKDVKLVAVYDINVLDSVDNVVPMEDGSFTISITIDDELAKYDGYKVVYIDDDGKIAEVLDAKLVDGKVVFTTTHLSTYGIIGYNNITNPNTGDNLIIYLIIGFISLIIGTISFNKLRKNA